MSHNSDDSRDGASPPYHRFGSIGRHSDRKLRLIQLANIVLCTAIVLMTFTLLLSVFPSNSRCWWPGPKSRCFWPFARHHQFVLISLDGFRHDYLDIVRARLGPASLPNFARLESRGVRALRSINAFPTVTMPNHQTLLTGLYPEYHGIVGNTVKDTHWPNLTLAMGNQTSLNEDPWLVGWPEPIWATLQKANGLAASLLWPLTDQPFNGDLPFQQVSQYTLLDSQSCRYPYRKRVQDLLWWLKNPRYRLDLVLAYFDEPDETGHAYGPTSVEVAKKIVELDAVIGQLLDGLESLDLLDDVDIVITADHGMASVSPTRLIALDDYVNASYYSYTQLSTVGLLYPESGKAKEVYDKLRNAHEHLKVYWLSDVPEYLHYNQHSSRMPPIVLIPDPSWYLVHKQGQSVVAGDHGYSTNFTDMHPFLLATGPSFRVNATVDEVHAVDLYPLICRLLRFHPLPNNGSLERVSTALLKPEVADRLLGVARWPSWFFWFAMELELIWFVLVLSILLMLAFALAASLRMQVRFSRVLEPKYQHLVAEELPAA